MGSAPSTPTADGRPSLSRINANTSMLRLTSRTAGVTSRRFGGRGRAELPPNGTPTDPADWPFIEVCLCVRERGRETWEAGQGGDRPVIDV